MEKIRVEIQINDFPKELHHLFEGAAIYDTSCHSGATVLYSDQGYYIKIDGKGMLSREAEMIELFSRMKMGAERICYISEEKDYLVTKDVKGDDATHWLDDPEKLCEMLADAMKRLHEMPIEGIPVSPCMDAYEQLKVRLGTSGMTEETEINHTDLSEGAASGRITGIAKLKYDTLIHGDFCLPNVMIKDAQFEALIDVGLAGVGDRHIDIFWALWSLEYNLKTDKYRDYFLDLYGREYVDMDILALVETVEMQ